MKERKQDYQRPLLRVVELQEQGCLLSGSISGEISGYSKKSSGGFSQEDDNEEKY